MANRRVARGSRNGQKKKSKASMKEARTTTSTTSTAADVVATALGPSRGAFFTGGGAGLSRNTTAARGLRGNTTSGGGKTLRMSSRFKAKGRVDVRGERIGALKKARTALRKQQQVERMTLKQHTAELERRRVSIRKGDSAKQERRELGKYIRQLKEEQLTKHKTDLASVQAELHQVIDEGEEKFERKRNPKNKNVFGQQQRNEEEEADRNDVDDGDGGWEDVPQLGDDDDSMDEDGLQDMFAHLIT